MGRVCRRIWAGDKGTAKPGVPGEVAVGKRSTARAGGLPGVEQSCSGLCPLPGAHTAGAMWWV